MTDQKSTFLDKDIPLNYDEYKSIRNEILPLLLFEDESLEDRLIAGAVWLDILGDFLRATDPSPGSENSKRKEVFDTFFSSMKNEKYRRPLRISRKSVRGNALKRMFLCLFLSTRQDSSKRRSNPSMLLFILRHYVKGYLYWGKIDMIPLKTAVPLRAFKKIQMDSENEMWSEIVKEWFTHFIRTDGLLKTENIKKGYLHILLFYAIAKWYCIASAFLKGSVEPDPEDILNSIQLTGENYMFHPFINDMDTSHPILKDILEGIFKRKSAPMILVRG